MRAGVPRGAARALLHGGARRQPSARFFRDLLQGSALLFLQQLLRVNAGFIALGEHCCRRNCHCEQLCCSGCSYAFKFDREASKPRAKTKHTSAKRSILRFARAAQGCCLAFRMVYLFSTSVQPQFAAARRAWRTHHLRADFFFSAGVFEARTTRYFIEKVSNCGPLGSIRSSHGFWEAQSSFLLGSSAHNIIVSHARTLSQIPQMAPRRK